jgi:hypothetical protein
LAGFAGELAEAAGALTAGTDGGVDLAARVGVPGYVEGRVGIRDLPFAI